MSYTPERWKEYKKKNKDRINALQRKRYTTDRRWEKQLRVRFGITPEQYWEMHDKQNGLCKICKKPQSVGIKLDVDHNHKTNKVRGLLCRSCNTGIGLLRDSFSLLWEAVKYLLETEE